MYKFPLYTGEWACEETYEGRPYESQVSNTPGI